MCVIGPTWPFRGGIAHYTTLLVKHLRERHTVRFITYIKQYPKWLYPGNTAMDPSPDSSVLRIECDRLLTPWNPLTWWRTYRLIKRDQPDVLLLQWWTPFFSPMLFFLTRMLKHESHIRVIFLCHHLIAPDGGIFDWFLARRILWRGNGFIVMSEEDFALLRRALPRARIKGTTHPPYDVFSRAPIPRDQARAKLGLPLDAPVVLFFGFVRRYKGLRHLLEAMRIARDRLPSAKLLVVGEFWEDERLYRDLIRQLGLQDAIQIYNQYVPNDQITVYFSAADVVALPYLEATQSGVAQLAIGFERPIIATNVGGMAEVVHHGETGFVVPPGDSQALATALIEFFTQNLAEAFSQRIRKDKESASWLPMIQLIEELAQPLTAEQAEAVAAIRQPSPRVF
ncbi:MAG: glycosyltransferase [Candidatus Brachytrichaceae bacterium NZ_4S206]|jgi:glycosyltransferase involved in cell wall biosynthesis